MADIFDKISGEGKGDIFDTVADTPKPSGRKPWSAEGVSFGSTPSKPVDTRGIATPRQREEAANIRSSLADVRKKTAPIVRPILEGGGAVGGGLLGAGAGPAGTVGGAALGYASGSALADIYEGNNPATMQEAAGRTLSNLATGATLEMGGQALGPALSAASKGIGFVAKPVLAKLAGTSTPVVNEALKGSEAFTSAMRGKVKGDEIVENAVSALNTIKENRRVAYQAKLQEVEANTGNLNITPISGKIDSLLKQYNVKFNPETGVVDTSRMAMGKSGRKDVEEILDTLRSWGSQPQDMTATGLDTLKRQLDDFYSDSSQARQFVSSLRDTVRKTIAEQVPAYDDMTKGYSDATKLIKDIEADLSMRKNGMSGRITADKTLRRLMSALRDNFEMRGELLEVLGNQGGQDLIGQVAGYTSSNIVPRGLAGVSAGLPTAAALNYLNPKLLPLVSMASPRVQGEFLRAVGKGMRTAKKIPSQAIKTGAIQSAVSIDNEQ